MDTSPKKLELISPYGTSLPDLLVPASEKADVKKYAETLPSIILSARSVCDLELLATGAFAPVDRFMNAADYQSVVDNMRLADGVVFPIPITLPISPDTDLREGIDVTLRDTRQNPLAVMHVDEIYSWDHATFARKVLATESVRHPLVNEMASWGNLNVSGPLRVIDLPVYHDFPDLRLTPRSVRDALVGFGNPNVVAFQTRNPIHRAHEEMTKRAMEKCGGVLLMHPVVGPTRPGDIDHHVRVRTYLELVAKYYDPGSAFLSLLPLAMRFAGPREAVWHAVIRRNYGANHFLIGRDHASPGVDELGNPFYPPYAATELVESFQDELGVKVIRFEELVYLPDEDKFVERSAVPAATRFHSLSGTKVRDDFLDHGRRLPEWFTRPEVADILQQSFTPRERQGVCIWFTGLSGAGKSTTAESLAAMLNRLGRRVTVLDGDVVRANLSAGLGFDKAGRDANIRRIGFVASEIVSHGGVAICAAISPYRETRNEVRRMIGSDRFIEVFVSTPLEVCEQRDPKGMYAKARSGEITNFTGVDDIYEPPLAAEIIIDTINEPADANARAIVRYLERERFVRVEAAASENLSRSFEQFREIVHDDRSLQEELGVIADRFEFVSRVIELAHDAGIKLTSLDVDAAMRIGRRAWKSENL